MVSIIIRANCTYKLDRRYQSFLAKRLVRVRFMDAISFCKLQFCFALNDAKYRSMLLLHRDQCVTEHQLI